MEAEIAHVKATSGAKFFDEAQKDVFPTEDFAMCMDLDKFDFVLKLCHDENGLCYITRA